MTLRSVSALGLVFFSLTACAAKSAPTAKPSAVDPHELYPFGVGHAWSYDVDTGASSTILAVTRVETFDGRLARVHTPRAVVVYEIVSDGIRVPADDAWLIRGPLREGATWPGRGGRVAELVSMTARAETLAGAFEKCVEVLERGGKLELEVRTVYCPGVGPVLIESTMRSNVSQRVLTVSARLRGFTVSPQPTSDR